MNLEMPRTVDIHGQKCPLSYKETETGTMEVFASFYCEFRIQLKYLNLDSVVLPDGTPVNVRVEFGSGVVQDIFPKLAAEEA